MLARLHSVADELGLPFGDRTRTYNSRRAQELGKWAESLGKGDAFHHAAFHAYFAEGKNIAEMETLTAIAASVGLPGEDAAAIIENNTFAAAVDRDWAYSAEKNVRAVPTFLFNDQTLVGAQPYEALARMMTTGNVKRR